VKAVSWAGSGHPLAAGAGMPGGLCRAITGLRFSGRAKARRCFGVDPDVNTPSWVGHCALVTILLACSPQRAPVSEPRPERESKEAAREPQPEPLPASAWLLTQPVDWEANAVMRSLRAMTLRMKETRYVHGIDVHVNKGYYAFDCSGMVDFLLARAAPVARQTVRRGLASRPLSADFVRTLARIRPGTEHGGWLRVGAVEEARPGDVVAWLKPKLIRSVNTGHVGILVLAPRVRETGDTAYLLRIADASRLRHQDDTRRGHDGFGLGTILLQTNLANGAPTGFSFAGSRARNAWGTRIVIGRPLR
jgi:hypothetical protein